MRVLLGFGTCCFVSLLLPFFSVNPVLVASNIVFKPTNNGMTLHPNTTFLRNAGVRIWKSNLMPKSRKESVADLFNFLFPFSLLSQLPSASCILSLSSIFPVLLFPSKIQFVFEIHFIFLSKALFGVAISISSAALFNFFF